MKEIVLETSTDSPFLALIENDRILYYTPLPSGPPLSKHLGVKVEELTKAFPPPYSRIILGVGPGSYTGTRVGAAIAQALCIGWSIPLCAAPSPFAFAPDTDNWTVIIDARAGGFYIQQKGDAPKKISLEQIEQLKGQILVSPHAALIRARLPDFTIEQAEPNALRLAAASSPVILEQLELFYF